MSNSGIYVPLTQLQKEAFNRLKEKYPFLSPGMGAANNSKNAGVRSVFNAEGRNESKANAVLGRAAAKWTNAEKEAAIAKRNANARKREEEATRERELRGDMYRLLAAEASGRGNVPLAAKQLNAARKYNALEAGASSSAAAANAATSQTPTAAKNAPPPRAAANAAESTRTFEQRYKNFLLRHAPPSPSASASAAAPSSVAAISSSSSVAAISSPFSVAAVSGDGGAGGASSSSSPSPPVSPVPESEKTVEELHNKLILKKTDPLAILKEDIVPFIKEINRLQTTREDPLIHDFLEFLKRTQFSVGTTNFQGMPHRIYYIDHKGIRFALKIPELASYAEKRRLYMLLNNIKRNLNKESVPDNFNSEVSTLAKDQLEMGRIPPNSASAAAPSSVAAISPPFSVAAVSGDGGAGGPSSSPSAPSSSSAVVSVAPNAAPSSSSAARPELLRRLYELKDSGTPLTSSQTAIINELITIKLPVAIRRIEVRLGKLKLALTDAISGAANTKTIASMNIAAIEVANRHTQIEHYEILKAIAEDIIANKSSLTAPGDFVNKQQLLQDAIRSLQVDPDPPAGCMSCTRSPSRFPTALIVPPTTADTISEMTGLIKTKKAIAEIDKILAVGRIRRLEDLRTQFRRRGGRRTHKNKKRSSKKTRTRRRR